MQYFIDLPRYWAYVHFDNGDKLSVANTDTLTRKEAEEYKREWSHKGNINRVTLETHNGELLASYDI